MELLLGRAGAGAARQPGELLAREIAALGLHDVGLAVALHALHDVGAVSAFERLDHAIVHFPHALTHLVEEPAVVGDDEQRALPRRPAVLEMFGKPVDGEHIEVVGGLVQGDDVPVPHQQTRQVHAAALSAGKLADARVQTDAREQGFDDFARPRVRRPLVVGTPRERRIAHRRGVVQAVALFQDPQRETVAAGDAPLVGLLLAAEKLQKR